MSETRCQSFVYAVNGEIFQSNAELRQPVYVFSEVKRTDALLIKVWHIGNFFQILLLDSLHFTTVQSSSTLHIHFSTATLKFKVHHGLAIVSLQLL